MKLWLKFLRRLHGTPNPRLCFLNGTEYTVRYERDRKDGRWRKLYARIT